MKQNSKQLHKFIKDLTDIDKMSSREVQEEEQAKALAKEKAV